MPTSTVKGFPSTLQRLSLKVPEGFKSKVVEPRNPKLVMQKDCQIRMSPSEFAQEMSQTTEQRLANTHVMHPPRILELLDMSETTNQKFSSVDMDQAMFQPFPSEIVFQNYTPSETYEVPLVLRNNDKIPRLIKVVEEDSLYFKVISPVDVGSKVAPGMASTFTVHFTPMENKDYIHRLICVTERERFQVPIRAIGARAILDFPDHLYFPVTPVKCSSQKTLLVRNIGNSEAKFQLSAESPFSVDPPLGTLLVGESMQITVDFLPKTTGDHVQDLLLHYQTGEDIYIGLYGAAADVNVRLDRNSIIVKNTYITMANQRSVVIVNRSDVIVHYQWKGFATEEEEEQQKLRSFLQLRREEEEQMDQFLAECEADPTIRDRLSVVSRTFYNQQRELQEARPAFSDDHFIVSPLEGDIWPNTTAQVNIIFKPQEAKTYQQTVYCDITGRESRLPLRIKGEGVGPKLQFNFDLLDMGNIFLHSKHSYEVLLSNKGYIDAPFRLLSPSSAMGLCFSFSPSEGVVPSGACHAMEVSFSSGTLGAFTEEFVFSVGGNPEPITLTFRGSVMGPTFHFSVPQLNFGDVSFGFPHTLSCRLHNTSLVPMTFDLRILGDGGGPPSVTSAQQVSDMNRLDWGTNSSSKSQPTEFTLTPSSGTLRALGLIDIQVTLCSNTVQTYNMALAVDVQSVGEEVLALPIHARCVVPAIHLDTAVLAFQRCFLRYPYQKTIKLSNKSDLPACYGLLSQEYEVRPSLLYSSTHPRGIIQPHCEVEIPLVLQARAVGRLEVHAHIAVFGSVEPFLDLLLTCVGEGPVVHVTDARLDFGAVPVLTDVCRTLHLLNQSPIPAPFAAQMVRSRSQWRVEPSQGEVPPAGELQLRLVAHLDDNVHFQDQLHLAIQDSQTHTIPVSAMGKGTTIVTDLPFGPHLDLGSHFSSGPCRYHFKLTNRGRRSHQLYWMTEGFPLFRRRGPPPSSTKNGKRRGPPPPVEPNAPVFSLEPPRVELAPGQSADMVLAGSSDTPKLVREKLLCQAILGQQGGKEHIMTLDVTCRFVSPVLEISAQELNFYTEKAPGVSLVPLYHPLVLKNVSSLPLSMVLSLAEPFGLCDHPGDLSFRTSEPKVLGVGGQVELWVRFDPLYGKDRVARVAEGVLELRYLDHPQLDRVGLRGEVHFPNLHFSSSSVDFGCILNHTEAQHKLTMANCSPLPVIYRWAFLVDQDKCSIRFHSDGKPEGETFPHRKELDQQEERDRVINPHELPWEAKEPAKIKTEEGMGSTKGLPSDPSSEDVERTTAFQQHQGQADPSFVEQDLTSSSIQPQRDCSSPNQLDQNQTLPSLHDRIQTPSKQQPQSLAGNQSDLSRRHKDQSSLGIEEVFDILPIYGVLQPGESQKVCFTFYGHADISSQVVALCEVEEGPTYEIALRGEASLVTYTLDRKEIDLGLQLFDHVAEAEIILRNTGRVGFDFTSLLSQQALTPHNPQPGLPLIIPGTGHVRAKEEQNLSLYYLPGIPEAFQKTFALQVSYFEPEVITVRGEGVFPRVCLDLPRNLDEERYSSLLKQAKESLERERLSEEGMSRPATGAADGSMDDYIPTYDALLQMEVERLLVKENAELQEERHLGCRDTPLCSTRGRKKLSRFLLPEYILDFGYVIYSSVPTLIVKVTNTGPMPVSFRADRRPLAGSGFSTELDRVRNLPYCETETFEVKFDPRGANLDLGEVSPVLPIQVAGGPTVQVRLRAVVTMPSLTVSTDTLQFGTIQCGQCQLTTIQLFNPEQVPCEWKVSEEERPKRKIGKHVPLHLRRKAREEQPTAPVVFHMLPSTGVLLPGDRVNVQVKFCPAEGKAYSQHLVISIAQSAHQVLLLVQGEGEEPQLDFSTSLLNLGPTLPCSAGEEAEVLVRNPCSFPIEFYSLEFDKQYLEEEKILCMMKGYDARGELLLPPRAPGETLPPELLDYYKGQSAQEQDEEPDSPKEEESTETGEKGVALVQDEKMDSAMPKERHAGKEMKDVRAVTSKNRPPNGELYKAQNGTKESVSVGELEASPVSRAIARHMGIDLSPEGQACQNRRGIAIIVHGAPLSGKTETAITLAKHYGAACLNIDTVVLEAVSSGGSPAGQQARELCARAALEHAQKSAEEEGPAMAEVIGSAGQGTGFLSVEALAKHTAEGNQTSDSRPAPPSASTRNKTSIVGGKKTDSSQPTATTQGMEACQIHRHLSVSGSLVGDLSLMSCVLPDELVVDILAERLQLNDCRRGVVIDGLETMYCRSLTGALQAVLKAFNNRRFIYTVNLSNTFQAFKAEEKKERETEEKLQREAEEEERVRLEEMGEEEYDALPEEVKERIHLRHLAALRERKQREQVRAERELEERRQLEEQERLKEEEDMKKRNKKGKREPPREGGCSGKKSQLGGKLSAAALRSDTKLDQPPKEGRKMSSCVDGRELNEFSTEGAKEPEELAKKKKTKEGKPGGLEEALVPTEGLEREHGLTIESDRLLLSRFRLYEQNQALVSHILQCWDRTQGQLAQASLPAEQPQEAEDLPAAAPERQAPSGKKSKREREREKVEREKERLEKEKLRADPADTKLLSPAPSQLAVESGEGAERESPSEGVPLVTLPVSKRSQPSGSEILQSGKLPPLEEVLDGLGLGPRGPPIPPSMLFSVVPHPKKRPALGAQPGHGCFTFMVPSTAEEPPEDRKELEVEAEKLGSISLVKEELVTPIKSRGRKGDPGRDSQKEKRRTTAKKGSKSNEPLSPPLSAATPQSETEQSDTTEPLREHNQRLTTFRWIAPPGGEVTLKIWFHSSMPGKFDQTLNFEVMGTRRRYQLYCRGICALPSISRHHNTVFAHYKKALQPDENLQKAYIVRSSVFEFGPLLCGKTRDRYKEKKYPENVAKWIMQNDSPLDAEIHFCFQHDTRATTFLLDPPNMTLKPNEKQDLTVWAYPTTPGLMEDSVVCCVRDNPNPAIFRLSCRGVRPELEVERKHLHFDKVLLHRRETRSLVLRNNTALPVAWRLSGLESLGEEFSVSQDQGSILPRSDFCLQMHFRAVKPINLKRAVRLEVSDAENILGIIHTENIQVLAEAYDVALDITFPKGADGGLDFGTTKVSEEGKLSVNMKNKGKYEIAFRFLLEPTEPGMPDLKSIFTITPQKGSLNPADRFTSVQFVFHSNREVSIREQPILRCQVIEPNIAEGGETIAIIPIKVSVQSLFTKYKILPSSDINFGPLVYGSRKSRTFIIENKGEFEMRYSISRMTKDQPLVAPRKGSIPPVKRTRSRESHSDKAAAASKLRRAESIQKDMGVATLARITVGVFSVSPGSGILVPGAHQVVTVDCIADQVGRWEECLALDIADRDPSDQPNGVPYRLVAEVCVPGIMYKDINSIFEEHRICRNSNLLHCEEFRDAMGVYVQDENKFVFNNALVGKSVKARFRLTNAGKVPCELVLGVKSVLTKVTMRSGDVFELTPTRLSIPSHSHAFAVVTFSPLTMQTYHAVFEATLEGSASGNPVAKTKALTFDLVGDGSLPCVAVLRPTLRTARGSPLLQFKRLLVGRRQSLPLVLKNDGNVPAQINIDLLDKSGVFTLRAAPDTISGSLPSSQVESKAEGRMAHTMVLSVGQQAAFRVEFQPMVAQNFEAKICLVVEDNQYEDTVVQLLGEGYSDFITLDNIGSRGQKEEDTAEERKSDIMHFGDCHVARPYKETLTMTNHSSSDVMRFEWPPDCQQVRFSPQVGHLHAGCAKDVTVTFCSEQPVVLNAQPIKCRLFRIVFQQPVDQVPDWDDRLRTVKWVDAGKQTSSPQPTKIKVVETDPEPPHSIVGNSPGELELPVSAVCDYTKFTCMADSIRFKDTLLYQTRVFQFPMTNTGDVMLEFSWQVLMEKCVKSVCFERIGTSQTTSPQSPLGSRVPPRPASALESVSNLLLGDPDAPPFSVDPSVGAVAPGNTLTFRIKFSPVEVAEYEGRLVCSIPNLREQQGPTMTVSGRSLLPYCHFHLQDSDYLSGNRRNPELRGPLGVPPWGSLDPGTRVVEFTSVGIGTSIPRSFSIVNPTNKPYSFTWKCEDLSSSPFQCFSPKGSIQPGKKVEASFEFLAQEFDTVESFWSFRILEQSISVPFLLVGFAREPVVYMDRAHLNLGSLLVGREARATVYVVNAEAEPFRFSVREPSCHSEALLDSLALEPLEGIVPPSDRLPLVITFSPTQEGPVTFNLVCDVKGKGQPLTLNVKAEGYKMNACVQCQSPDGAVTELHPGTIHQMDFKQVELSDKSLCQFLVSNPGKFSLDVHYELWGLPELLRHLEVEPERGSVAVGQQRCCKVTFFPLQRCVLKETGLLIKIKNGATFRCCFSGSAVTPSVDFSFLKHNFGMNFIYCAGMAPPTQILVISNRGERGVSLECLFSNTAFLEVGFQSEVLPPGGTMEVPITFYPREAILYQEKIVFEINDCAMQMVEILGQGIKMKIDVEDPKHRVVNLGALQIGQKTKKVIPVVNNSRAPLTFCLLLSPSLLDSKVLSVTPPSEVTLKAEGGRCLVEVQFSPRKRIAPFSEELLLECMGTVHPLLVLKGSCHGVEVHLDQDYLPFGAVAQRCQASRRIIMVNAGDRGLRFKWDIKMFAPDFSISPTEGYICPGMEVPFEVTFAPLELSQDLRYENLPCTIEGGKPLKLTLVGSCIAPPVTKEVVNFSCPVRTHQIHTLSLSNRTNQLWTLRPIIEGEHWTGPPSFILDPYQQNKAYEITYRPLVMTADGRKHQGSIFFSFPDGNGMLYILQGVSEPPKASGTFSHEMPCKTHYSELVPVHNWLAKPQRFRVLIEIIKPERPDNTFSMNGLDYLDVPALAKKDYKLSFFTYKEGLFNAKVTFCNEVTQEYLFYYLNFKATPPGVIQTVEMVTAVRQTASATVKVENPLPISLFFNTECRSGDISVPPQLSVPSLSTGTLMFEFQPLQTGETTARLTLHNSELGHFHYELQLKALPAPREKPLYFCAPLGSGYYATAKFTNYSRVKAEYTCQTDSPDFTVEKNFSVAAGYQAGTDVSLEVYFEPCQLGETRGLLTLCSGFGGEYLFPLFGTCSPPKAQGPFSIRAGSNVSISFKNVFLQTTAFSFQVDNPAFTVKGVETIRPKKTHNILVSFEGLSPGSRGPCCGKLTISSPRSEGHGQSISWVYYLKGFCPDTAQKDKTT